MKSTMPYIDVINQILSNDEFEIISPDEVVLNLGYDPDYNYRMSKDYTFFRLKDSIEIFIEVVNTRNNKCSIYIYYKCIHMMNFKNAICLSCEDILNTNIKYPKELVNFVLFNINLFN